MNRTLLSLNLGSNLIGDHGASKLAEVRKLVRLLIGALGFFSKYACVIY